MHDTTIRLASRQGWTILADYEEISIERPDGVGWRVGGMYGNPRAALITVDQRWAVIVELARFGEKIKDVQDWRFTAAVHSLCEPPNPWWFEAVYEPGEEGLVRLVADLNDVHAGIYDLRLPLLTLEPRLTL